MNPDLYQELVRQISSLQKQVDGLVKPEVGRWIDWTPTVTQAVAVTVTVNYARYIILNDTVIGQARVTVTGNGTAGNNIYVEGIPPAIQPANAGNAQDVIGSILILDNGTARYAGILVAASATVWSGFTDGNNFFIGNTPNFGLVAGDIIGIQFAYEQV